MASFISSKIFRSLPDTRRADSPDDHRRTIHWVGASWSVESEMLAFLFSDPVESREKNGISANMSHAHHGR
jgi:hypothetical protein